jgi:hypothetical protein
MTSFVFTWSAVAQVPRPMEALSGTWKADISDAHALVLTVGKEKVEMGLESGGAVTPLWAGMITFPDGEAARHFDWVGLKQGGTALPDNKCLYRLAGDTLLVIGGGPKARPTRFLTGPGDGPRTLVFTRVKGLR